MPFNKFKLKFKAKSLATRTTSRPGRVSKSTLTDYKRLER